MKSEHLKLSLVIVLLVVAAATYWYFGASRSPLADSVSYVCVATGKIYRISQRDLPNVLPGRNPDTAQDTLIPVIETADGKLVAYARYARGLLQDPELARLNKYVDPNTLEVLTAPR